jgi:predicted N-acyltransferase
LAKTKEARAALLQALLRWCEGSGMSSLHLLFVQQEEADACTKAGLMLRHGVQFHWKNTLPDVETLAPTLVAARTALDMPQPQATALRPVPPCAGRLGAAGLSPEGERFDLGRPGVETVPFRDFEHFLASLSQEKRKKIRQERRKVAQAGVSFRWARGTDISTKDWDFFYRCYERTYLEHGNAPYLSRDFFARMANTMAENWLLFTAQRGGQPIATSLIAVHVHSAGATDPIDSKREVKTAYGRYWGALERVDCLHFEACYYQPLEWCIAHGYQRFEGGAQGEHKMARALLPVRTTSAHWLAHPDFADAVARFLEREGEGVNAYVNELEQRSPFRQTG